MTIDPRAPLRRRVIDAAVRRLRDEGPSGVTTRGVAEDAGVQPPAIYRLFGDKDGLLEAVAEHLMATAVAAKTDEAAGAEDADPVDALRAGWAAQIEFGLDNPAVFRLLSDPDRVARSPAAQSGRRVLEIRVERVAATGRLAVQAHRAVDLLQGAAIGTIHTLLAVPAEVRDPGLGDAMLHAVLDHILLDERERPDRRPAATAAAFRALVPRLEVLTGSERRLLAEWVDRASDGL